MGKAFKIDWQALAGEMADKVRPETRTKYFPQNPLRQYLIQNFLDKLGDALESFQWTTMLDVGAGEGFVDYYISRRFPEARITGLEPEAEAAEVARSINPGSLYVIGDGKKIEFADDSFDVVISCEVLEHIVEYRSVMSEMARVSKGPAVVTVPAFPFYQLTNFMIGKNWKRLGEHPDHLVRFTGRSLKKDMEEHFGPATVELAYPWLVATAVP